METAVLGYLWKPDMVDQRRHRPRSRTAVRCCGSLHAGPLDDARKTGWLTYGWSTLPINYLPETSLISAQRNAGLYRSSLIPQSTYEQAVVLRHPLDGRVPWCFTVGQ